MTILEEIENLQKESIVAAVNEYVELTRESFFKKYGFENTPQSQYKFFINYENGMYECKPIIFGALSHQYNHTYDDHGTGGVARILRPVLQRLNFDVVEKGDVNILNDRIRNDFFHKFNDKQWAGLQVAISIVREYFPKIDMYPVVVSRKDETKYRVSLGKRPRDRPRGKPLFIISDKYRNKNYYVKLRSDDQGVQGILTREVKFPNNGGYDENIKEEHLFYLNDFDEVQEEFKVYLGKLSKIEALKELTLGEGYLPDDYEQITLDEELNDAYDNIENNKDYTETEKSVLAKARLGQSRYRNKLIELWGGCAVTGVDFEPFLIASHIKPWRDSDTDTDERLDENNGLILSPNYDTVFDKGYISFSDNGDIKISSEFKKKQRELLKIDKNSKLLKPLRKEQKKYLKYHRKNIFLG